MNVRTSLLLVTACASAIVGSSGEEPAKRGKTILHSTFDTAELGQPPGAFVQSTFDTDALGRGHDQVILTSHFDKPGDAPPEVLVSTSFEAGVAPEVFLWDQDSPFQVVGGGRTGKSALAVRAANALLDTHPLPAVPGARYEMSVWFRGNGRVRVRAHDGTRWVESAVPGSGAAEWRLARIVFQAAMPPPPPKDAKVVVQPRPRVQGSVGIAGPGNAEFDDFQIVRLPDLQVPAGTVNGDSFWLAHQMEYGDGLAGSKAVRVRNGTTLSSRILPVTPGKEYVIRFYCKGLESRPSILHRVTQSICAGRFYVDAAAGDAPPRYWGYPMNLLLLKLGEPDTRWRLIVLWVQVPEKLWGETTKGIVLNFASQVPASAGFDYEQTGDLLVDDLTVSEAGTEAVEMSGGDDVWYLPDRRLALLAGSCGGMEILPKQGIGNTAAISVGRGETLVSCPIRAGAGELLSLGWYYRGIVSEAGRADLSRGTRGCGRVWAMVEAENRVRRETGAWSPITLSEPGKADREWKYSSILVGVPADPKMGASRLIMIHAGSELQQDLLMRGGFLLDDLDVRHWSPWKPETGGDRVWLGVPDPSKATVATGTDSLLEIVAKGGVNRSRAIRLQGRYALNSLSVPVVKERNYVLSFQYRVLESSEWPGVGGAGGSAEIYWGDIPYLGERLNLTVLKAARDGQPDTEWRVQEVPFAVPAQFRNQPTPTSVRLVFQGVGTVLLDEVKLDQVE